MRAALLSVIGLLLLGAAARAQPYIYHGNDTGGIIPVVVRERGHGATAGRRLLRPLGQVPPHHQRAPAIRRLHRVQLPVVAVHQPLRPAGGTDPIQLLLSARAPADHQQVIRR